MSLLASESLCASRYSGRARSRSRRSSAVEDGRSAGVAALSTPAYTSDPMSSSTSGRMSGGIVGSSFAYGEARALTECAHLRATGDGRTKCACDTKCLHLHVRCAALTSHFPLPLWERHSPLGGTMSSSSGCREYSALPMSFDLLSSQDLFVPLYTMHAPLAF